MEAIFKVHPAAIRKYVELSWEYSYRMIWHRYLLKEEEIEKIKNHIKSFYQSIPPEEFRQEVEICFQKYCKRTDAFSKDRSLARDSFIDIFNNRITPLDHASEITPGSQLILT